MLRRSCFVAVTLGLAACQSSGNSGGELDAHPGGDAHGAPDARPRPDASTPPDASVPPPDAAPAAELRFAIVGDTRPPNPDDTAHYPTAIITKIWQDVEAHSPRPDFAVSTGDYMFASTNGSQQNPQLDLYLGARANFSGQVYAAMGNHECTGATDSNCGSGTTNGVTRNYTVFMNRMVQPLGHTTPYYAQTITAADGSWTAKFVFVAANAWTSAQATWLMQALSQPTTYTFVIRHEGTTATTAPGVTPSQTIINAHPLTLLIVGHTHEYAHYASDKEVICGNGGAPLTSSSNYGYGIVERLSDGRIQFTEYDYQSNAVVANWAVHANGTPG